MTRKDYVLIAKAFEDAHGGVANNDVRIGLERAASFLAFALKEANPKFDSIRFLSACRGEK